MAKVQAALVRKRIIAGVVNPTKAGVVLTAYRRPYPVCRKDVIADKHLRAPVGNLSKATVRNLLRVV